MKEIENITRQQLGILTINARLQNKRHNYKKRYDNFQKKFMFRQQKSQQIEYKKRKIFKKGWTNG